MPLRPSALFGLLALVLVAVCAQAEPLVVDNAPLANYFEKDQPPFPAGPIQLQTHGGEIRWRNIFLREISRSGSSNGQPAGGGAKP